jgi:Fe-S-cluster-containing dehydrogenase component
MLDLPPLIDRRRFMQLMAAALALAEGGCVRAPPEAIVPYAREPEGLLEGLPLFFATALTRGGYAHGVLVQSHMGRPTKIEGNPAHPASLGSTGPIEQGRILELWDPVRSRSCLRQGQIASWDAVRDFLRARAPHWAAARGRGLRILRGQSSSATWQTQESAFLARYPEARVHTYEALNRDSVYEGARLAFGRPADPVYHFERARIVVSLDADFLASFPGCVRYARDYALTRRPESGSMSRLYAAECTPTLTGAAADHRLAVPPSSMPALAESIWAGVQRHGFAADNPWLRALLGDLASAPGASLIVAGESQPPRLHYIAHLLNQRLGNVGRTVEYIAPVCGDSLSGPSLGELVQDMRAQRVETLFILDCNPVYTSPVDLEFAQALHSVRDTVHHGLYVDETAEQCLWHIPAAHELETWSDARAFEGSACIQQPLLAPLYGGRSAHELMAILTAEDEVSAHTIVRANWQRQFADHFEERWQDSLREGLVRGSASKPLELVANNDPPVAVRAEPERTPPPLELAFRGDPHLWDGRYAPLAWLQELPKPLTQLTWDNAALLGPALAAELQVTNGALLELSVAEHSLLVPAWIVPQHASKSLTLHLGGGRVRAGPVGSGHGVNAYHLRRSAQLWDTPVRVRTAEGRVALASVQQHHRMEGRGEVRSATLPAFQRFPGFAQEEAEHGQTSLYTPTAEGEHAWGMSINLGTCIGCNACTVACQAENNIPTVGKEEVLRGRQMHWIRVDEYQEEGPAGTRSDFQPVPCMQCEHAPCEVVCPVEASVHDPEGINVQVYNRCIGTRYCSNNCPYKVRRFNFLQYSRDEPALNAQRNPEVTVRMRGVMEKCNYCLQRVVRARITSDRENRPLRDGEVVTACQAVCPTQAIVFGDLKDRHSAVSQAKSLPRNYALLGELNTRPRTTYLAKITNPADTDGSGSP